jgi:NAD(P)-dependent dehydrogenase (short-subunit alcohol dehydrogenase family)
MGRLDGKVAVVTGAASGVGKASVERFVEEGARVVGVDLRPAAFADPNVIALEADVTDADDVDRVVRTALDELGAIDVYFSNAGILVSRTPVEETSIEDWQRTLETNLTAFFLAARALKRSVSPRATRRPLRTSHPRPCSGSSIVSARSSAADGTASSRPTRPSPRSGPRIPRRGSSRAG